MHELKFYQARQVTSSMTTLKLKIQKTTASSPLYFDRDNLIKT